MESNVQRYIFSHAILKDETGGFVRYEDHRAEIARLEAQIADYEKIGDNWFLSDTLKKNTELREHMMLVCDESDSLRKKLAAAEAKIERVKALREEMVILVRDLHMPSVSPGYIRNKIDEALADTEAQ